jgi:hypothetical protein
MLHYKLGKDHAFQRSPDFSNADDHPYVEANSSGSQQTQPQDP